MTRSAPEKAPAEKSIDLENPKMWELLYLKQQLNTYLSYREMVAGRGGEEEDYQAFKERWQADKEKIEKIRSQLPEALFDPENPDSYLEINRSQEAIAAKLQELEQELGVNSDEMGDIEIETEPETEPEAEQEESEPEAEAEVETTEPETTQPAPGRVLSFPAGIWGHKNPDSMTLEEKEQMLGKAKRSGPLAMAYWENEIANHNEKPDRDEAEKLRKKIKEQEEEIKKLKEKATEAQEAGQTAEVEVDQQLAADAEEELKEKKKGVGERFKDGVQSVYEFFKKKVSAEKETREEEKKQEPEKEGKKITRGEVSGFFRERVKGFVGGFGWWEVHQAEKLRVGTKETGQALKIQAELLEQEEGLLNVSDAWAEAHEIEKDREKEEKDWVENQGAEPEEARRLAVDFLSAKISSRKREYNKKVEDKMVAAALIRLEEKLKSPAWIDKFWKTEYKTALGGQEILTPEKKQAIETRIRAEIVKLRKGQLDKDLVNFVKLSRESLDKRWWSRYIFAGLDMVLMGLMAKWIAGKMLGKAAAGKVAGGGVEKAIEVGMKDTVWEETKRFLIQHGIPNPTDAVVLKYAPMVAQDSMVTVPDWGIIGHILDTQMPGGYLLKFGRVASELVKLGLYH